MPSQVCAYIDKYLLQWMYFTSGDSFTGIYGAWWYFWCHNTLNLPLFPMGLLLRLLSKAVRCLLPSKCLCFSIQDLALHGPFKSTCRCYGAKMMNTLRIRRGAVQIYQLWAFNHAVQHLRCLYPHQRPSQTAEIIEFTYNVMYYFVFCLFAINTGLCSKQEEICHLFWTPSQTKVSNPQCKFNEQSTHSWVRI